MTWQLYDTWVVLTGALCAMACALPGAQLVLRRRSMMGDAISHAVLPGVAIAFLITATNDPLVMLVGAIVIGILTTVLVDLVQRAGRTEIGASMGHRVHRALRAGVGVDSRLCRRCPDRSTRGDLRLHRVVLPRSG